MEEFITIMLFLLGLLFGSFFNVVGLRVPRGESIVYPPSHCGSCEKRLRPSQLIRVLSWLIERGRCRHCRARVSAIYPLMEGMTGVLFALIYTVYGWSVETLLGLLFASLLVIITVSDIAYRLIPDRVTLPLLAVFAVLRFFTPLGQPYWMHLLALATGFGLFFLLAVLSKGGMGGGDIKLFAVVGLFLGIRLLPLAIFFSTLLGTVYGLCVMVKKGTGRKTEVPFGPFIAAGSMLAYLAGDPLLAWYVQMFT